jgi:hypothetical protein
MPPRITNPAKLETVINTLEHISTTALPASQMRRIIRGLLLDLYKMRNEERAREELGRARTECKARETYLDKLLEEFNR